MFWTSERLSLGHLPIRKPWSQDRLRLGDRAVDVNLERHTLDMELAGLQGNTHECSLTYQQL